MNNERITNCAACGWADERGYDADCGCFECSAVSEAHLDQHNQRPRRKPMKRCTEPRQQSTLLHAIKLRA